MEAQPHIQNIGHFLHKIKDKQGQITPKKRPEIVNHCSQLNNYCSQPKGKVQQRGKLKSNDSNSTGEVINRGQCKSRTHSQKVLIPDRNTLKKTEVQFGATGARPEEAKQKQPKLKDLGSAKKPQSRT